MTKTIITYDNEGTEETIEIDTVDSFELRQTLHWLNKQEHHVIQIREEG